jgi:hypothetical protein
MKKLAAGIAGVVFAAAFTVAGGAATVEATCTDVIGPDVTIEGDVIAGPGCVLQHASVTGDVIVKKGGSLGTFDTEIGGNVLSQGGTVVQIGFFTTVGGDVEIRGSTKASGVFRSSVGGDLLLAKNTGSLGAEGTSVGGNMRVWRNEIKSGLFVFDTVSGDLEIGRNDGSISLEESTVDGTLACFDNEPAVSADSNTVGSAEGECA